MTLDSRSDSKNRREVVFEIVIVHTFEHRANHFLRDAGFDNIFFGPAKFDGGIENLVDILIWDTEFALISLIHPEVSRGLAFDNFLRYAQMRSQ